MINEHIYHNENEFICDLCDKKFPYKANLKRHIADVHFKELKNCSKCSKVFGEDNLKAHEDNCLPKIQRFECWQCQKSFKKEKHYKEHIKVHDENTFNCELCDKSFTTQRVLNLHIESTSLMISDDKGL